VPRANAAFSPADGVLGLVAGLYSPALVQDMVWLSALLTYEQCIEVLERMGHYAVSLSSLWRRVQDYGEGLLQAECEQQRQVNPERMVLATTDHNQSKGVSMDGGMVNIRCEGWKEVKVGVVYDVEAHLERDERTDEWTEVAHAQNLAYTAVLGDVEQFGPAIWSVAVAHALPSARQSSVTADGAEWIWNLVADYFPDSRQIVDWYHAKQHLCDAAQALFSDQPQQVQVWLSAREDDLFVGNIAAITQPLDEATLAEHSHYFHTHKRRMQYQEFREEGLPIGSGTVESSVKQFKARLAGPGMRWNRRAAQRMLLIRAAVLDHSFDQRWHALFSQN